MLTSVLDSAKPDNTNVIAYDKENNKSWKVSCEYIPAFFLGTGDAFASVLISSLLQGDSLPMALDRSVSFIKTAIRSSYGFNYSQREGVLIEKVLDTLKIPVVASSYELIK